VALGFNTADEVCYAEKFAKLGATVLLATVDGSAGVKGFVTDAMAGTEYSYFYTCGPMLMLEAVNRVVTTDGQFSFEERMGCGFGACMGCSCKTLTGSKRICKDGPVLERGEILWPTHE
jgi:dihydroorotate dehydrogenase electron transfer subunit